MSQKASKSAFKAEIEAGKENDLGNNFARQGKFAEAQIHYFRAIKLDPKCAEAHNNLGNVYRSKGDITSAVSYFESAVQIKPDFVIAHNNLGVVLTQLKRWPEAETCHRRAIALDPRSAESHFNLGNIHFSQKKFEEAVDRFKTAVTLNPSYSEAFLNLGNAYECLDKLNEAEECYRRSLSLRGNYAEAHHNLGKALWRQDRLDESILCYQQALSLKPDLVDAWLDFGNALMRLAKHNEALECYRRALNLRPGYPQAHTNAAMANLTLGNFALGWKEYEWRWKTINFDRGVVPDHPLWDGGSLKGRTIVLHCEQGFGDSIQFIRYVPLVKAKGGHVHLVCPPSLRRLFASMEGVDTTSSEAPDVTGYVCRAPLLSLPLYFSTTLETIPSPMPYLSAPSELRAAWQKALAKYTGLKVGIVWAGGSRDHPLLAAVDRRRSLHLDQLTPLGKLEKVQFFSLQKGKPSSQLKTQPQNLDIIDFTDKIEDFADTAALIECLDLVIAVDTSIVHLAGALGKPVWCLSRFDACWRWLKDRKDSPWYPTLRLFTQERPGEWDPVIAQVCDALRDQQRYSEISDQPANF